MRHQFKAPWDFKLIMMTSLILLILIGPLFMKPGASISLLLTAIILICAAYGVYGYSIQDNKLKIIRLGWSKDIELSTIKNVEAKPHAMMGSLRTWGIGGLFGYIGYFKNSILGNYKAYATHTEKAVLIETADQKYIVTPDDPAEFIKSLKHEL